MNYKEKYEYWLNNADADTVQELSALSDTEIKSRFNKDIEFGTGGIRGVIGAGTDRINIYTVRKATKGFADYIKGFGTDAMRRGVVIAYDNRRMSKEFAQNTAGVLAAEGIQVYLFSTLHTTPQLSFAVRFKNAYGGVVITASHNPAEYNGYKLYDETGCQLVPRYTDRVIEHINAVKDVFSIECDPNSDKIELIGEEIDAAYYEQTAKLCSKDGLDKAFKIVYSPQHGTGAVPVVHMLKSLGYQVFPVTEQMIPDSEFSNTKNPNPESDEAFELPIKYAEKIGAALVIVTDPDCDRLGVAVSTPEGFVRLTGNQSGAILLEYVLKRRGSVRNGVMINTIVTSDLGDRIAGAYGVRTEKTLTGFKFIGDKIHEHEQLGDAEFVFGYEESYGCLIGDYVRDKDGIQASVMLCEAAAYYRQQGLNLVDVINRIYAEYGYCMDYLCSITMKGIDGAEKIRAITSALRSNPPKEIAGLTVIKTEDYLLEDTGLPKSDVIKLYTDDGSWIAVRPSGTEPKCKFYYSICAQNKDCAEEKLTAIRKCLEPDA